MRFVDEEVIGPELLERDADVFVAVELVRVRGPDRPRVADASMWRILPRPFPRPASAGCRL
jgi:hypothetical protein